MYKPVSKTCKQCGARYRGNPNSMFCSQSCSATYANAHPSAKTVQNRITRRTGEVKACEHCGTKVYVPKNQLATFRFCSYRCHWRFKAEHNRVEKCCKVCGTHFHVIAIREKTAKFCSRKCYYKDLAKRGSIIVHCAVCEAEVRRSPSKVRAQKAIFCSVACRGKWQRKRASQSGYSTPTRNWMKRRGLLEKCVRCGYDAHPEILAIHHKDRNRRHNEPNNLEVLCPNCHALEHYGESNKRHPWENRPGRQRQRQAA